MIEEPDGVEVGQFADDLKKDSIRAYVRGKDNRIWLAKQIILNEKKMSDLISDAIRLMREYEAGKLIRAGDLQSVANATQRSIIDVGTLDLITPDKVKQK